MNVNERSSKIVISTGTIVPRCASVLALYSLQKSMIATPCGPSAVPTGGAGVAPPAGIWIFTMAETFFLAISRSSSHWATDKSGREARKDDNSVGAASRAPRDR